MRGLLCTRDMYEKDKRSVDAKLKLNLRQTRRKNKQQKKDFSERLFCYLSSLLIELSILAIWSIPRLKRTFGASTTLGPGTYLQKRPELVWR